MQQQIQQNLTRYPAISPPHPTKTLCLTLLTNQAHIFLPSLEPFLAPPITTNRSTTEQQQGYATIFPGTTNTSPTTNYYTPRVVDLTNPLDKDRQGNPTCPPGGVRTQQCSVLRAVADSLTLPATCIKKHPPFLKKLRVPCRTLTL